MKILHYKTSLKNKLAVLVMMAVIMVVATLGIYFDSFLKKKYFANAQAEIFHSYQRLAASLSSIEKSLKDGVVFIQTDEQISASIELINNYEDKKNYNKYLIDEEKKLLVNEILNRVKFTFNDNIALYNSHNEIIAFVEKESQGYRLNYISYSHSKPLLYQRYENESEYTAKEIDLSSSISFNHIFYYKESQVNDNSVVSYHHVDNNIIIKSHQNIIDLGTKNILGHIEMSRVLDMNYFSGLSTALNIKINYSFDNKLNNISDKWSKKFKNNRLNVAENDDSYYVVLKQTAVDSIIYYQIDLDKKSFNVLLNESRSQLLMFFALVTLLILFLMRYIINLSLSGPLTTLAEQIKKIEKQDYSESNTLATGDEMEVVSKSINQLAQGIQARETELTNSLHKQTILSDQVKESEVHLQTLIKTLPDLVWLKDTEGVYLSCNKKFEELYGQSEADIIGKTDFDFVSQEAAIFLREKDMEAVAAGTPSINEEEVTYSSDGHKEILETIKTPMYSPDGTLIGVLGVGRDITERKKIEGKLVSSSARLTKLASRLPGMVYQFELDVDGNMSFSYMSDAVEELYHITAKEALEDVNRVFSLTHPDDVEKVTNSILKSAEELTPWKLEYRLRYEDGIIRWLYGNSIPEKMPEGGVRWYGFITDITKNKERDETIRRTQKMDALGKLTGGIAHDYNNMLGVVLGYSELLKDMVSEQPKLVEYVDEIIHAGDRGAKLTSKLLSFSRKKASDEKVLNINEILQSEKDMLQKTLMARIKLEFNFEADLWLVCLDGSEFEDVVLNMSINAMHAMDNSGTLKIITSNCSINEATAIPLELNAGDYVKVNISDTGCGLSDIAKEKIFDPFYSTKGDQGTGLGLTQVYGFVKRSGGTIKVESKVDKGTQFTLYFPRNHADDVEVSESKIEDNINVKGKERILVVDDEPALLKLACEVLEKQGYQVFKAEHAVSALEILEVESIDLLVSDVIMPEIDGYELATIVQEKFPNIKIQLVSGFTGSHKNNSNVLFKNLLHKPYSSKSLLKKIQDILM